MLDTGMFPRSEHHRKITPFHYTKFIRCGVYPDSMSTDYHVFLSADDCPVTVEQDGDAETMEFPSLSDATRHLRSISTGYVVIHDRDMRSSNRIPLAPSL
jgi:hypothetical protein